MYKELIKNNSKQKRLLNEVEKIVKSKKQIDRSEMQIKNKKNK